MKRALCSLALLVCGGKLAGKLVPWVEPTALQVKPQLVSFAQARCMGTHRERDWDDLSRTERLGSLMRVDGLLWSRELRVDFTMRHSQPALRDHVARET